MAGPRCVRHGAGTGIGDPGRGPGLDGQEVSLTSYAHFVAADLLTQVVMERMLAGVATRRAHPRRRDKEAKSTSRSASSRRFVRQTETALAELMSSI
ncbi:MAG: hypothetical protein K2X52_28765 [Mycobacteriaceae bacterium]|nr:hypothetical protein [Mycobacteriaceae bacterium]